MRAVFPAEAVLCVNRPKSNVANLLVKTWIAKGRQGGTNVVGINPKLPPGIRGPLTRLLERLCEIYPLREIGNDIKPAEVAAFRKDDHAPVDIEALFGTHIRTRTLVALHVLGGEDNMGRMQRNVLEHFAGRVRVALEGFVEEGILVRVGKTVRFNPSLEWLPELRALLQALAARMPEVSGYAKHMDRVRDMGDAGTAHAYGTKFRLFGSRVNQALLAALALYGPSNVMKICAAAGAVTTRAIDPLVESGLVARTRSRNGRTHDIFSLNAAHPTYRELRAPSSDPYSTGRLAAISSPARAL